MKRIDLCGGCKTSNLRTDDVCIMIIIGAALPHSKDLKIFNGSQKPRDMAEIFDYIPIICTILFAAGIVGAILYERARSSPIDDSGPKEKSTAARVRAGQNSATASTTVTVTDAGRRSAASKTAKTKMHRQAKSSRNVYASDKTKSSKSGANAQKNKPASGSADVHDTDTKNTSDNSAEAAKEHDTKPA